MQKRFFLGIPVPSHIGEALLSVKTHLNDEKSLNNFHWYKVEKYHLTLSFVGLLEDSLISQVELSLQEALKNAAQTKIQLTGIDWFPPNSKPRLLVALVAQTEALLGLQKLVSHVLEKEGIEADKRPYLPHITLGRGRPLTLDADLSKIELACEYQADCVLGYESRNTELGSEYVSLFEAPLLKSGIKPA